jgi:DUF2075 family protein
LKICNERPLQFVIGSILQEKVQGFDDDYVGSACGCGVIVSFVDLGIAATAKTIEDVIPAV